MAVPLGFGLGAWPLSHVGAFSLPGAAAAAVPPGRSWLGCAAWVWAGCLAFVLRGCVCPAGCCCGGCAAGARLGGCAAWDWAGCLHFISRGCRLLWCFQAASYLSVFNAFACRLALVTSGGVRCCFGLPPFVNNRPLSEGAAGVSRLGGGLAHVPSLPALLSLYAKVPRVLIHAGDLLFLLLTRFQGGDDLVLRGHALAFGVLSLEIAAQVAGGLSGEQFYQGQGQDVRCQKHPVRLP